MKLVFLFFVCFCKALYAAEISPPVFLKGTNSFTIYSQISTHTLDLAFESTLENCLSKAGKIVSLRSPESFRDNFYTAISNSTFLKLSLENRIVEVKVAEKNQFKIEIHLVLECVMKNSEI